MLENIHDCILCENYDPVNFKLYERFPSLDDEKNGLVFLSGGLESTLVSYILTQMYDKQRIIGLNNVGIFSGGGSEAILKTVQYAADKASDILGIQVYKDVCDTEDFYSNRDERVDVSMPHLSEVYNIHRFYVGFTRLFLDIQPFKNPPLTLDQCKKLISEDPITHRTVAEEFHFDSGRWADKLLQLKVDKGVYDIINRYSDIVHLPIGNGNKCHVSEIYQRLGVLDLAWQTSSCTERSLLSQDKHCGRCFNCQQRWDGFWLAGIEDKTKYLYDDVKYWREEQDRARSKNLESTSRSHAV